MSSVSNFGETVCTTHIKGNLIPSIYMIIDCQTIERNHPGVLHLLLQLQEERMAYVSGPTVFSQATHNTDRGQRTDGPCNRRIKSQHSLPDHQVEAAAALVLLVIIPELNRPWHPFLSMIFV